MNILKLTTYLLNIIIYLFLIKSFILKRFKKHLNGVLIYFREYLMRYSPFIEDSRYRNN